jgi:Uma2 family endonuclease
MTLPAAADSPTVPPTLPTRRCAVVIEERAKIPAFVDDLASFRRWAHSDDFPEQGQFAYLQGEVWVDLSMEELLTHNQVKMAYTFAVMVVLQQTPLGRFVGDRMRLSHVAADLSVEPDGLFYTWQTLQSGRLRFVEGVHGGIMELEGSPDMTLEIVSDSSVKKDTVRLRELYWRAEVPEYWLVDVRGAANRFEILRRSATGYVATATPDGWQASTLFGRSFRLARSNDPLGHVQFAVEIGAPTTK